MKQSRIVIVFIGALAVIVAILLYNKSRMAAEAKSDVSTSVPVSVATAGKQMISGGRVLVGTIAGQSDVAIISETQGKITRTFAEVGDYKSAGDAIVQVDDELKQAALATAEVNFRKAQKDLERFESLVKQEAATEQQVESARLNAKAAEAQLITARREVHDARISAPVSGTVTSRPVDVGTYVQKGSPIAEIVDISRLKVKLNVAESDVFRLGVGDPVVVSTSVYPGKTFPGKVRTISAKADEAHTYPVEITLQNDRKYPLKAGMFASVSLSVSGDKKVLSIPRLAIAGSAKNPQVFVVDRGVAHRRDLVIGSEFGTAVEVLSGLQEGETVVVNGQNNLKENSAVTVLDHQPAAQDSGF